MRQAEIGRLSLLTPKEPVRRYQRERPGELIHLDIKKLGCFSQVGHRVTGDRRPATGDRRPATGDRRRRESRGAGWEFVHVAIDDATRVTYLEVLPDEKRGSATGFLVQALRWFRDRGVKLKPRPKPDSPYCQLACLAD